MIRPYLKFPKTGLVCAGLFLCLATAVFFWVLYSATTNPADSGESGIMLLPFGVPWIMIMPQAWLGLPAGIGAILFNALILYLLFGGLRFRITTPQGNRSCLHCGHYPLRKKFPPQSNFAPYNICVDCGNKFTVDRKTVRRHLIALTLALPMLATTILTFVRGNDWLWPMIASHVVFWGYFIYGNAQVVFVPYPPGTINDKNDG